MNIGLLMINGEDDVLERTLDHNCQFVDWFYVLDGTEPNETSRRICNTHPKCFDYVTDAEIGGQARDGSRQVLYEMAAADHGRDHWFFLLHGDELWTEGLPNHVFFPNHCDGVVFPLPVFFPRAGEPWQDDVHPLDQLRWNLGPGWPEFRMFRGGDHVNFDPAQHFDVRPQGITNVAFCPAPINHYLYRSPDNQRERAQRHLANGFDPDNYIHILEGDNVYWTDEMIAKSQSEPNGYFRELRCTELAMA